MNEKTAGRLRVAWIVFISVVSLGIVAKVLLDYFKVPL